MKELRKVPGEDARPNGDPGPATPRGGAIFESPSRGVLRLAGKDPVGMLNAILTNDVPEDPDLGAYALLLNPKGRIQADLRVLKDGEAVLVDTEPEGADAAREILGRYAPFSRVKLEDLSDTWAVLGLYGSGARELLGNMLSNIELAEHQTTRTELGGVSVLVAGVATPVPGYDLILPAEHLASVRDHLLELGATPADHATYEAARVTAGIPRFGADMTPENFPGEAGVLDRSVSFQKGCYPGQETVARMRYRGHPNKTLYRLAIEGGAPETGAPIHQGEKQIGTITSVAPHRAGDATPALGYLSRKTDPDAPLVSGELGVRILGEVG